MTSAVGTSGTAITSRVHSLNRPNMVSVGTIVWLSSELMFFAGLFAMYFTIRSVDKGQGLAWPGAHLNIALGSVNQNLARAVGPAIGGLLLAPFVKVHGQPLMLLGVIEYLAPQMPDNADRKRRWPRTWSRASACFSCSEAGPRLPGMPNFVYPRTAEECLCRFMIVTANLHGFDTPHRRR